MTKTEQREIKKHRIISAMQFYETLEKHDWNRRAAGKELGISQWGCRKRIERLRLRGVHVPDFEHDKVEK